MAGLCTCYNSALVREDEFAGDVSNKGSNTYTFFLAQTSAPPQVSALAQDLASTQAIAPASSLPDMYTNINLQRTTKLALILFVKG